MLKSIKNKMTLLGVLVFLLVSGTAATGFWMTGQLRDGLEETLRSSQVLRNHMQADMMHDALRSDVLASVLAADPSANIDMETVKADVAEHTGIFHQAIAENGKLAQDPEIRKSLDDVKVPLEEYTALAVDLTTLAARNPTAAMSRMGVFQEQFSILESAMAHVAEVIESEAIAASQRATASAAIGRNLMGMAVGIGTLFALGLTFFARRSVVTPIQELASDMQQLVEGRTDVSLKGANRKDELGEIGRGVLAFQEVVTARARRDADEAEERRRQEMDSAERETATRLEQSKAQSFVVENLSHGLENLSQGDLTVRLDRSFAPEFEPIRIKFNDSVAKLEGAIGNVVTSIGSIRSGLSEINTASNDLAQRTEQQAANLEETVAALGEVTTAVNETAEGAGKAQTAASAARGKAQKGGEIVGQAVAAMSQIEKSSEQINQIIGVIDEIAFQTNLLALNAGVEAARAGEAGKGFAVVAQEVRGLAQRSAEAAKEIKTLIATSRSQVESGVELVTASGKSLDEIVAEVSSMAELIATIAVSAKEQATSLREVSGAADQMDKVTQQNAAMVEEATAASQTLTNETEELASAMAQFKTAGATVAGRGQASRSGGNAAPAANRARPATPPRGVPQMKTTGTGGAARAEQAKADSWEEF